MSDGDYKQVTVRGRRVQISPHGNNQTWSVRTELDDSCSAVVDFNVPGKPNPPPCNLSIALWEMRRGGVSKLAVEFTDKTGKLDPNPLEPINEVKEPRGPG